MYLTLTIAGAAVAFTLGGALWFGLRRRGRAGWAAAAFVVVAPLLTVAATATWHTYALDSFVESEAGQLRGIIATPQSDYVHYDYKPNGKFYERWAFTYPFAATVILLLAYSVSGSIMLWRARFGLGAITPWLYAIAVLCFWLLVVGPAYLEATAFFV